jgi:sulfur carrier protein ThiS
VLSARTAPRTGLASDGADIVEGAILRGQRPRASVPPPPMRVHLHPQRRTVEVQGRRRVGQLLIELGILPGTAMVIRGELLLTEGEVLEDVDEVEIRAVISGGTG